MAAREDPDNASKEDLARRIFGERAAFYTTSEVHTDAGVLARVVELAEPSPDARALDVGTGTGHTAFALAPHVAEVVATDLTPAMLAEAERLRLDRQLDNVELLVADAHALPFPAGAFAIVTCRRAAHHFTRLEVALGEMVRVLEPGGRLVIDDRSVPEHDRVDAVMNRLDVLHDASHVRQYRASEWRELLGSAGLRVDVVEGYLRHRPLSALTRDVADEDVARIEEILAGLDDEARAICDHRQVDGEPHLNHWFVTARGIKA